MFKNFKRIFVCFFTLLTISVTTIGAADIYVACQKQASTGHGYYKANCSGTSINMIGHYDDSSESWMINNYTGTNANRFDRCVGVYAGRRNGADYHNVGVSYLAYAHIHHFTQNRI